MRRFLLTAGVSISVMAFAPAAALAHHHPRSHHRSHHSSVRHRTFGSDSSPTTTNAADNAGTVDSFTNGVLTIKLNDTAGTKVSGTVTDATELECDSVTPTQVASDDHGPGSGDDNGSGDDTNSGENSSSNDGSGDNNDQEDNAQSACTTNALTPGATVREAQLRISSGGSVWQKVELVQP